MPKRKTGTAARPAAARVPSTSGKPAPRLDAGVLPELVGFHIRLAQVAVYTDFMRDAPVRGITPGHTAVLIFIDRNPGLTQQWLCDRIRVEKSTMVVRLHKLEQQGLVRRVRSTEDRRQNSLQLTRKGQSALKSMLAHIAQHEDRLFSRLSAAQKKQLIELLLRVHLPRE